MERNDTKKRREREEAGTQSIVLTLLLHRTGCLVIVHTSTRTSCKKFYFSATKPQSIHYSLLQFQTQAWSIHSKDRARLHQAPNTIPPASQLFIQANHSPTQSLRGKKHKATNRKCPSIRVRPTSGLGGGLHIVGKLLCKCLSLKDYTSII